MCYMLFIGQNMILLMKINFFNLVYNDGYISNMYYVCYNIELFGIVLLIFDFDLQVVFYGIDRSIDFIIVFSDFIY